MRYLRNVAPRTCLFDSRLPTGSCHPLRITVFGRWTLDVGLLLSYSSRFKGMRLGNFRYIDLQDVIPVTLMLQNRSIWAIVDNLEELGGVDIR